MGNFCSCFGFPKEENNHLIYDYTFEEHSYIYEDSEDSEDEMYTRFFYRLYD